MNYEKKYLKYKTKYLELKIKKNYVKLKSKYVLKGGGGSRGQFRVIRNTGSDNDGALTNQCMWISIRDFLRLNGSPDITTDQIRQIAGIPDRLNHTMFDFNNTELQNALRRLVNHFNLRLRIFPVEHTGQPSRYWYNDYVEGEPLRPAEIFGPSLGNNMGAPKNVNLAQYGTGHFNLIVGGYGLPDMTGARAEDFTPMIPVSTSNGKTILKEVSKLAELSESEKRTAVFYQQIFDLTDFRRFLKDDLRSDEHLLAQSQKNYDETSKSTSLDDSDKRLILASITKTEIDPLKQTISQKKQHINELDSEIIALNLQIGEYK